MNKQILERITFKAGDAIFREGERGYRAFIIQEGDIDILRNVNYKETIIATVGKGGIIGEMALIDESPRMATARAASAGVVIVVTTEMFNSKMKSTDPFIRGLLNILVDHIRRLSAENSKLKSNIDKKPDTPAG